MTSANIASHLPAMAALQPDRAALIAPKGDGWESMTFAQLNQRSDRLAHGLSAIGVTRGVRTALLATPSLDFFALVFALFKVGAVVVMIDPGIGRKRLLACLAEAKVGAFVGIPMAHVARLLFPRPFVSVKAWVTVGRRLFWGGHTVEELAALGSDAPFPMEVPEPNELAAVLYTSGSTGIPKGALYTHAIFDAQVRMIRDMYGIAPGEIDLPTFPLFALFDPALGMTAVLPDMDFRSPAKADPAKLARAIEAHGCTSMFGSPALLDNLGRWGVEPGKTEGRRAQLKTLRRVLSAGAPVRTDVLKNLVQVLPEGALVHTPYGATESLPISSVSSAELLGETGAATEAGQGVCVGKPVPGVTVRLIRIDDNPIATWSDELLVPQGTIGEITVRGPVVTASYWERPEQTAAAKIQDGDEVVHRVGDLGWFDTQGRLWMCGRKSHRVETAHGPLYTVPVEELLNTHPRVRRTALVGVGAKGQQSPVLLLEREAPDGTDVSDAALVAEVQALAQKHEVTKRLSIIRCYPGAFPVDARHNAKIEREKLALWAEERAR